MFKNLRPDENRITDKNAWFRNPPAYWALKPARILFDEIKATGYEHEPMLSVTIRKGVILQAELLSDSSKKDSSNLDKTKYKLVEPGDIVYNKMRAWQGALGLSTHRGIVSPAYVVMRPQPSMGPYLHVLMRTSAFATEAERWSYGITSDMWSLRPEHFKLINFPIPPKGEQAAIVKYLGHAHARIDRAIAAKRKLIALLEEQKQAIIYQAVTRGVDPAVVLKDSGVLWIGEIPAHWAPTRLKFVLDGRPANGVSPQISEDGDLQTFSLSAVRDGKLDVRPSDEKFVSSTSVTDVGDFSLRAGDVVLVRGNGNINLVGRSAEVMADRPDSIYPDLIIRLRTKPTVYAKFLVMLINSTVVRSQIDVAARTAVGTFKINGETVKNLRFALPSLREQIDIVNSCLEQTEAIRLSIDTSVREIELLREFRTRLTSDVVTGQVDVREIAATLPEVNDAIIVDDFESDEDEVEDAEVELVGDDD